MKNFKLKILYVLIKIFQPMSPRFAGYLSSVLWFAPQEKKPSRAGRELLNSAQKRWIDDVVVYSWEPLKVKKTLVLVHGWGGRWDQFGLMIPFLVQNGYCVVAFDLPAHGESKKFSTSIPEWMPFFKKMAQGLGDHPIYICHSFGMMAISHAIRYHGIQAQGLVGINSPSTFHFLIEQFSTKLNLKQKTIQQLFQNIKKRVGPDVEDLVNIPFYKMKEQLPVYMIADEDDHEVPFVQHKEAQEILKDHFFVTNKQGHNRILRDSEAHKILLKIVEQCRN